MFRFINIASDLKVEIETITCVNCNQVKLSFKSVEFDEDFKTLDGNELTVDAFCKACRTDSKVIVHISL